MTIMEKIEEFLNDEELVEFFEVKDYKPVVENGWFSLTNKNSVEKMKVFNDFNNPNRIRFKGKNWAFSINKNKEGKLYLDHLLIGDVEKDEYDFIMRHNISENNNEIIVKLIDDKNRKHLYQINENEIKIEQISFKEKEYNKKSCSIKDYLSQDNEYQYECFHFEKDENLKAILKNDHNENITECIKEFLILEKTYPTITNYIGKRIPFLTECITYCNNIRELNVKEYKIKRQKDNQDKKLQKKIG